jgi:hypothetical protein
MFLNDLPQNNQKKQLALNNARRTTIYTHLTLIAGSLSSSHTHSFRSQQTPITTKEKFNRHYSSIFSKFYFQKELTYIQYI